MSDTANTSENLKVAEGTWADRVGFMLTRGGKPFGDTYDREYNWGISLILRLQVNRQSTRRILLFQLSLKAGSYFYSQAFRYDRRPKIPQRKLYFKNWPLCIRYSLNGSRHTLYTQQNTNHHYQQIIRATVIRLRTETSGGILWIRQRTLGIPKIGKFLNLDSDY